MSFGVILCKSGNRYSCLTFADDLIYDFFKENMHKYAMEFTGGGKDIPDVFIDYVNSNMSGLANRLNFGEKLDLERELESALARP